MGRRLFCEICPLTYEISRRKEILKRIIKDTFSGKKYACSFQAEPLPYLVYKHNSLIRRKLGKVDFRLQENKAVNLSLAAPKISGVLIKPGETFSFWRLVGSCTRRKGYLEGLTIASGKPSKGVGGGMCQMTNLIHWMTLHSPLNITERHHHDKVDLFPDFNRQVPFGVGTSIFYNYLDYQFLNDTQETFQLLISVQGEYLCGELRCTKMPAVKYHVHTKEEYFTREKDGVYRNNTVERIAVDRITGNRILSEIISRSHAKIQYEESFIQKERFRENFEEIK